MSDIGFLLGDEEAAERAHLRLHGGPVDRRRIAGVDELLGPAGQRDNIVPDDADPML